MSFCVFKSGSSSKPSSLSNMLTNIKKYCNFAYLKYVLYALFVLYCLGAYYLYLDNLYLVDEVLDVGGPREFAISEQLTLRVIAPKSAADLDTFVLTYSVCPVVKDIQIIWNQKGAHPSASSFKYQHTHSLVNFNSDPSKFVTLTDSILLLDADVFIGCSDLAFSQSVWRSSQDAGVGFFPRHLTKPSVADKKYEYKGISDVMWSRQYSILLASGLLLRKSYLEEMDKSALMADFLWLHPDCYSLAVPLFAASLRAPAPIFVDVDVSIHSSVALSSYGSVLANLKEVAGGKSTLLPVNAGAPSKMKFSSDEQRRSMCLTHLMSSLNLPHLPTSEVKSVRAKEQWIW